MAKGRIILNTICSSRSVHKMSSDTCRLAWTWLITFADAEGRMFGDSALLASWLFPRRSDINADLVDGFLEEYTSLGLIVRYEVDGEDYIWFPKFHICQPNLRVDREPQSRLPKPPVEAVAEWFRQYCDLEGEALAEWFQKDAGFTPAELRQCSDEMPELLRQRSGKVVSLSRSRSRSISKDKAKEKGSSMSDGDTKSPNDAAAFAAVSLLLILEKHKGRKSSATDKSVAKELTSRSDYDTETAEMAIRNIIDRQRAKDQEWKANSLSYFKSAIISALEGGNKTSEDGDAAYGL